MRDTENIRQLLKLKPDYMGFIFYPKSKRYVEPLLDEDLLKKELCGVNKVGVFVNASTEEILAAAKKYELEFVQLHGDESVGQLKELKAGGLKVIKVFSVGETFDFAVTGPYKPYADYFLFDTQGEGYGGTGRRFDWKILEKYDNEIPFFLSGGIGPEDIDLLRGMGKLNVHAIDINSRFEIQPALKDINLIKKFKDKVYEVFSR